MTEKPDTSLGAAAPTKPQHSPSLDAHPPIVKLYPQLRARLSEPGYTWEHQQRKSGHLTQSASNPHCFPYSRCV
jgi:hypothetical protein